LLVEKISGGTLEEFAREYIFEPLGMHDTYWRMPKSKLNRYPRRPKGHKGTPWLDSENFARKNTSVGGGLKSSMADLLRFGRMYLNGGTLDGKRILSPASVRLLTKNANEGVPDSLWFGRWLKADWGLGWNIKGDKIDDLGMLRSPRAYDHGGYGGARLLIDPDAELVAAIYMAEKEDDSVYDDMNCAVDILYGALD
jgi:CubicO group peptidase (beta-lactamase class C family)